MNFLIEYSTLGYQARNYTAVQLSKLYPGSKFAATVGGHEDVTGFLREQDFVKYDYIYDFDNLDEQFLNEDVNHEELRAFEETIHGKSLWRFIAMDRIWGKPFVKECLNVSPIPKEASSSENILKIVHGYINYYKKIFSEFKPDVVIFKIGMHSMMTPIFEQFCRNMNVPFISLVSTRVQNYIAITPNKECTFPQVNETYKKIMKREISIDPSPGEKCYNELISSFNDKQSTDYFFGTKIHNQLDEVRGKHHNLILSNLRTIAESVLNWRKMRMLYKSKKIAVRNPYGVKRLYYNFKYNLYCSYQKRKLLFDKNLYDAFNPDEKYLYFPLTVTPEYTTQVQANMWINQLMIIDALAKSVPCDWQVYVKEHPANVVYRARPSSFYKEIKSYANVKLISVDISNHDLISNAQFVVNILSTTGWEAVLFYRKPVISFTEAFYDVAGLSKQCYGFVELSRKIHEEQKRINEIDAEERKRRIVCLLNAIILNSFWLENPQCLQGERPPYPEKDLKDLGEKTANIIKKFLEDLH